MDHTKLSNVIWIILKLCNYIFRLWFSKSDKIMQILTLVDRNKSKETKLPIWSVRYTTNYKTNLDRSALARKWQFYSDSNLSPLGKFWKKRSIRSDLGDKWAFRSPAVRFSSFKQTKDCLYFPTFTTSSYSFELKNPLFLILENSWKIRRQKSAKTHSSPFPSRFL